MLDVFSGFAMRQRPLDQPTKVEETLDRLNVDVASVIGGLASSNRMMWAGLHPEADVVDYLIIYPTSSACNHSVASPSPV